MAKYSSRLSRLTICLLRILQLRYCKPTRDLFNPIFSDSRARVDFGDRILRAILSVKEKKCT